MEWVWRIVISLSVLVTGLLGSLMTLGLGIYIVFADSLDGNFWSTMNFTNLTGVLIFFLLVYLTGFVLLFTFARPKNKECKEMYL